jgi:long-subunit acyl-CoA synthetase (AMP-forming)
VLRKPGSIGKPTFGVEGKIVDFDGKDVPRQVGELIFTTRRMMKEYYKNPEMTEDTLRKAGSHRTCCRPTRKGISTL